jgi:hypothetical protein
VSETCVCPKCGFAFGGAGFGMATCTQCGEIFLIGAGGGDVDGIREVSSPVSETSDPPHVGGGPASNDYVSSGFEGANEFGVNVDDIAAPNINSQNSDLSDLADFGNQQQPSTSSGGLVYNLTIAGIDTVESRQELTEVLSDKRLGINIQGVLASIKQGRVVIVKLNPVKASVIVGRLKSFSFTVSWDAQMLVKSALVYFFISIFSFGFLCSIANAEQWARHEVNLKGYQLQIIHGEDELRELIAKKKQIRDPKERDEILKEIIKKNAELRKSFHELKAEEEHIRFQHPEKGDDTVRKYRHLRLKSIEELENEVGVDGQLSRLKSKVKNKYGE